MICLLSLHDSQTCILLLLDTLAAKQLVGSNIKGEMMNGDDLFWKCVASYSERIARRNTYMNSFENARHPVTGVEYYMGIHWRSELSCSKVPSGYARHRSMIVDSIRQEICIKYIDSKMQPNILHQICLFCFFDLSRMDVHRPTWEYYEEEIWAVALSW